MNRIEVSLLIIAMGLLSFILGVFLTSKPNYFSGKLKVMGIGLIIGGFLHFTPNDLENTKITTTTDTVIKKDTPIVLSPSQIKNILPDNN